MVLNFLPDIIVNFLRFLKENAYSHRNLNLLILKRNFDVNGDEKRIRISNIVVLIALSEKFNFVVGLFFNVAHMKIYKQQTKFKTVSFPLFPPKNLSSFFS